MKRYWVVLALISIVATGAYGGPVTIDLTTAGAGGTTVLNKNLSGNGYIPCITGTTTNGDTCTTSNGLTNALPSGTAVTFTNVVFNSAQVPFNIQPTSVGTGTNNNNDVWAPGNTHCTATANTVNAGCPSITINMPGYNGTTGSTGMFGVDEVWTMLNDIYATPGYQGVTLVLSGVSGDGVTPINEDIFLTAGVDYRSIGGFTLPNNQDPTPCDIANIGSATLGSSCTGAGASLGPVSGTDSGYDPSNPSGVTITDYNTVFKTKDTLTHPDNYWLDAQAIFLGGAFSNGYLDTIKVISNNGSAGNSDKAILSAVTVDQVATPEPGTVALFAAGIGSMVFFRRKRARNNS